MACILIIDDEASFRSMLRKRLEKENNDVFEADNGKAGKMAAKEKPPDLIITDLIMPEEEGIKTIMDLKKEAPQIPVIAISGGGKGDPANYLKIAKMLGARHTFQKPLDWPRFLESVNELLE